MYGPIIAHIPLLGKLFVCPNRCRESKYFSWRHGHAVWLVHKFSWHEFDHLLCTHKTRLGSVFSSSEFYGQLKSMYNHSSMSLTRYTGSIISHAINLVHEYITIVSWPFNFLHTKSHHYNKYTINQLNLPFNYLRIKSHHYNKYTMNQLNQLYSTDK